MKRLLAAFAAAGFLLTSGVTTSPALAAPGEGGRVPIKPAPATQLWSTRQVSAQPGQSQAPQWLRLDVEQLTPRVVTGEGDVTISGKIVNIGDRRITDIDLRLERGDALTSEESLRAALREPASAELKQPRFTPVADLLEPGQSRDFSLTVPLRGGERSSLEIDSPGIYPVLANVNGTPDNGGRARLAALSTLLPVLSVPGGESRAKPADPARTTVLWPLADEPRLVGTDAEGRTVLTDDELAGSLSLGGRLYGLLQSYEAAVRDSTPMASSLCLAVDPDLLRTVDAMSEGYQVRGLGEGAGRDEATLWLDQLRQLSNGRCVLALPYADADLVALSRAGLTGLEDLAVRSTLTDASSSVVEDVLDGVQPLENVVWPEGGVLDQQTLDDLAEQGVTSLVLDQSGLSQAPGTGPVAIAGTDGVTAVRIDSMVSAALVNGSEQTQTIGGVSTPSEAKPVSVQNALAAMVFRAGFADGGQHVVIAPPRRWNAPLGEMNELLTTLRKLFDNQFAAPAALQSLVGGEAPEQTAEVSYPVETSAEELPEAIVSQIAGADAVLGGLQGAMAQEDSDRAKPSDLIDPLKLSVLRASSSAWRGDEAAARDAVDIALGEIGELQGQVTATEPNSPILLGSGDSPVPINIVNRLDLQVTVRVVLDDTPGVRPEAYAPQVIPGNAQRLVQVPVELLRSGRFSVDVQLMTESGVPLGENARVEVSSAAYGTITVVITATGAIALVLLSARRIFRRIRASRAPGAATDVDPAVLAGQNEQAPTISGDAAAEKSSTS
ncbi:DUF6049 family protein [Umezawaea beigongshangensis]|uniref:DUF6049 family protein n=1 Tax=Umezawaea beigongshangensis TaxID=2780383 RepID=UPI0018F24CF5|nr:DUF6049 family protein [Umezawaea beigongshangensis]